MEKTVEQIKNEMEANSKAWHTADSTTRKNLETANQELGKQIGGVYDAAAGKWSDSNGNPLFGNSDTNANGGVDINGAINDTEKLIDKQIENLNNYESTMTKLYQDRTDFEVKKIEQQKEEAKKDLEKEQTAAYVDYQKQINPYGANAEQFASQGMGGTGYAESSRVKMYSAYQNRVAIAKESYNKAVVSYNNAMTEARLQNSTVLAQLAFDTLQKSLELSLQGLQYKNELLMKQDEINYSRKRDALADERYEEEKKYSREQDALANEIQYATLTGDYSKLEAKGWVIDYDKLNQSYNNAEFEKQLKFAITAAEYGYFEPLENNFGIKVSDEYKEAFKNSLLNNGGYYFSDDYSTETENDTPIDKAGDYNPTQLNITKEIDKLKNMHIDKIKNWGKNIPSGQLFFQNELPKAIVTGNTVTSVFYEGNLNTDGKKYGYMKNGYQPKGISGHGLLQPSGRKTSFVATTINGVNVSCTQNVWVAEDETLWVWNGKENGYEPYDIEE